MIRIVVSAALASVWLGVPADAQRLLVPEYSAASIVNAATFTSDSLAPNTLATIFGSNLSWSERALTKEDMKGAALPTQLAGVQIFVAGIRAHMFYVSEKQVNFLIPTLLRPGDVDLVLTRDGVAGPIGRITLSDSACALFHTDANALIATHVDGSVVNEAAPASGGEVVILYATGLGATDPAAIYGQVATAAAPLARLTRFVLWLDGAPVERERILYAGVTPGFAGLYQINLQLPNPLSRDPEVRIGYRDRMSPAETRLIAR